LKQIKLPKRLFEPKAEKKQKAPPELAGGKTRNGLSASVRGLKMSVASRTARRPSQKKHFALFILAA